MTTWSEQSPPKALPDTVLARPDIDTIFAKATARNQESARQLLEHPIREMTKALQDAECSPKALADFVENARLVQRMYVDYTTHYLQFKFKRGITLDQLGEEKANMLDFAAQQSYFVFSMIKMHVPKAEQMVDSLIDQAIKGRTR